MTESNTPQGDPSSVAFLQEKLAEMRVRKGPLSVIVQTLEAALRSGTQEDLDRGRLALDILQQSGEQRPLAQIPRRKTPPEEKRKEEEAQKLKHWGTDLEKVFKVAPVSDGIDFAHADPLSTRKRRQLLARKPRRKPPSNPSLSTKRSSLKNKNSNRRGQ